MDKDLDKVISDMYELEEDIDEGLNEAEDYEVTAEDLEFAKEVYDLIQELIDTDDATEDSIEESMEGDKLHRHYLKHCIADDNNKKSTPTNIYYDFSNEDDYRDRISLVGNLIGTKTILIHDLSQSDFVADAFDEFFGGNCSLHFSHNCDFEANNGTSVHIILRAYADDVTKNYTRGRTVDLQINSRRTLTMYPVDSTYIINRMNRIINSINDRHRKMGDGKHLPSIYPNTNNGGNK